MKYTLLLLFFAIIYTSCQQHKQAAIINHLDLDFEENTNGRLNQWLSFGSDDYSIGIDSMVVHHGKYSAYIEYCPNAEVDFKAWALEIPGSYNGNQITLTGYIKSENVTNGFAGLWMRIDPEIAFDNMGRRGITGTTPWTRYKITLPLNPKATRQIVVGGLLIGKGKIWIDDLSLTIDGHDIQTLSPIELPGLVSSGISSIQLDEYKLHTLKQLGLIWGFLKYYHPEVAKGARNWDQELFKILPKVILETDIVLKDSIFLDWINGLGPIRGRTKSPHMMGEVKMQPNTEWIENSGFSNDLVAALIKVRNAERSDSHHYVDLDPIIKNPVFKNEDPYGDMKCPDVGYRILSLYRYWNVIQYFYPYKYLITENWSDVLEDFIPRFIDAQNEHTYIQSVLELISRIHDTHANIWSHHPVLEEIRGKNIANPIISFVEDKATVTGFHKEDFRTLTSLKVGDVILSINNKEISDIIKEKKEITPASNYPTQLRDIAANILRTNESTINISYLTNGTHRDVILGTYSYDEIKPYNDNKERIALKTLPDNIGYLYPAALKKGEINSLWKQIKKTKGLIIDMRCYPSDFIVFSLGAKLASQKTPFVKFSTGSLTSPGLFTMTAPLSVGYFNPNYYRGKVIILINEMTQSQAEYTTMALKVSPNATVIGSTTAGADGNVSTIILPGGVRTMISGIGVYYPNGEETQRVGIIPDIVVKPTIQGVIEGRDELLEKALLLIHQNL